MLGKLLIKHTWGSMGRGTTIKLRVHQNETQTQQKRGQPTTDIFTHIANNTTVSTSPTHTPTLAALSHVSSHYRMRTDRLICFQSFMDLFWEGTMKPLLAETAGLLPLKPPRPPLKPPLSPPLKPPRPPKPPPKPPLSPPLKPPRPPKPPLSPPLKPPRPPEPPLPEVERSSLTALPSSSTPLSSIAFLAASGDEN